MGDGRRVGGSSLSGFSYHGFLLNFGGPKKLMKGYSGEYPESESSGGAVMRGVIIQQAEEEEGGLRTTG